MPSFLQLFFCVSWASTGANRKTKASPRTLPTAQQANSEAQASTDDQPATTIIYDKPSKEPHPLALIKSTSALRFDTPNLSITEPTAAHGLSAEPVSISQPKLAHRRWSSALSQIVASRVLECERRLTMYGFDFALKGVQSAQNLPTFIVHDDNCPPVARPKSLAVQHCRQLSNGSVTTVTTWCTEQSHVLLSPSLWPRGSVASDVPSWDDYFAPRKASVGGTETPFRLSIIGGDGYLRQLAMLPP